MHHIIRQGIVQPVLANKLLVTLQTILGAPAPASCIIYRFTADPMNPVPAYYDDGINGDFDSAALLPIGFPIINWELRIAYLSVTIAMPFRQSFPAANVAITPQGAYCGWIPPGPSGMINCGARSAIITTI